MRRLCRRCCTCHTDKYYRKTMHPLLKQIEDALAHLEVQRDQIAEEAKFIVDDYWSAFKVENKKIQHAKSRGEETVGMARLAPVIEDMSREGRKPAIRWKLFSSKMRKLANSVDGAPSKKRGFSEYLKPTSRGYTHKQLKTHAGGWEAELAIKTEERLSDARKAIEHIHSSITGLQRVLRHSNLYNQSQQEESNG